MKKPVIENKMERLREGENLNDLPTSLNKQGKKDKNPDEILKLEGEVGE